MKECNWCSTPKELEKFHKDSDNLDGYSDKCKTCFSGNNDKVKVIERVELPPKQRKPQKIKVVYTTDTESKEEYLLELEALLYLHKANDNRFSMSVVEGMIRGCKEEIEQSKGRFVI